MRLIALLLTFLTGFTGLVYEVAWQKYLAALLGSHSEATAAVLAIFLGGLSAGYALFGAATRRLAERARRRAGDARLLLVYGAIEAGIGVYALLFPALFSAARSVSLWLPAAPAGLSFGFDVALAALLIGPPSILMGATIPFLTLALAGDLSRATRVHAWVYGFNTAGAFVGALAAGFFLIERLGLDGGVHLVGFVNLLAGGAFALLDRRAAPIAFEPGLRESAAPPAGRRAWAYTVVAGLAGFAMMALQTTFNRVGALTFGSSEFTFAMIVAVFVLSIAVGSLAVSALPRIPSGLLVGSQWLLVLLLFLLYGQVENAPYWAHLLRTAFGRGEIAFYPYYYVVFTALLAVLLAPIALSGALLPLLFDRLRNERGELGSVAGRLYSWNTVGSLAGALIGGYVLLFWLDLHHVYRIALAALTLGAAILTVLVARTPPFLTAALVLVPALAALAALPAWRPERLASGLFRQRELGPHGLEGPDAVFANRGARYPFHRDGPSHSVSVREPDEGGPLDRSIVNNGKSDGSLEGDYTTMSMAALVPALVAESIERSFIVGWGTGVTAGELASLEGTREVVVAEISREVIEAAPFFDRGNLGASQNPKIRIVRGDAYRALSRADGRYDLVLSEPSNPWVTGVEMLYSVEFLEAARAHLSPGGIFAQWIHVYEMDEETLELVLRTYAAVFPGVSVWYADDLDLLLLGFDDADRIPDVHVLQRRFRRPDFRAGFARAGVQTFPALLAHELIPVGVLHAAELTGELHTLRHPILSHRAARAFFTGRTAQVPKYAKPESAQVGARNSLLRRFAGRGRLPESLFERVVREDCLTGRTIECATVLARWKRDYPRSERVDAVRTELAPGARRALAPATLDSLIVYFGRGGIERLPGDGALDRATRASTSYLLYFSQPFPFERRVLRAVWRACDEEGCDTRRREVEALVGDLDSGPDRGAAPEGSGTLPDGG